MLSKPGRGSWKKPAVFVVFPAVLLAVFILFMLVLRDDPAIKKTLKDANELVTAGLFERAAEKLDTIFSSVPKKYSLIEYLRLHAVMSAKDSDYDRMVKASKKVIDTFGNDEKYWIYRVIAESRASLHEAALHHCDEHLRAGSYDAIRMEVYLAAEKEPSSQRIPEEFIDLMDLIDSDDPEELIRSATQYNNPNLALQGLVVAAKTRGTGDAYNLAGPDMAKAFPEALLYLAYDAGENQAAFDILAQLGDVNRPDLMLLKGDIYSVNGFRESATEVYGRVITLWPEYSPLAYHNLSRFSGTSVKDASGIIEKGKLFFPDDSFLQLSGLSLLLPEEEEQALDLLEEYMLMYPEDMYAKFLWDHLRGNVRIPEVYAARLWLRSDISEFFRQKTAAYSAWYFGVTGRQQELKLFLEREEDLSVGTAWFSTFSGILNALEGKDRQAEELFLEARRKDGSCENLYNAARMRKSAGDTDGTIQLLTEALMQAEEEYSIGESIVVIETELASLLYSKGLRTEALYHARNALERDPAYLKARQLEQNILKGAR